MSRSKNFSLTMNNPTMPINEFADLVNKDALYARCQSEKGENGTLHFQACVGYTKLTSLKNIIKKFTGCHCEVTRNALAAWDYCGKEDTRVEGPYSHGIPPAALNVKGSKAKTALEIIAMGADKALEDGHVNLLNYGKIVNNIDLYTNRTQKVE